MKLKGSQLSVQLKLREGVDVDQLLVNLALELGQEETGLAVQNGQLSLKVIPPHLILKTTKGYSLHDK